MSRLHDVPEPSIIPAGAGRPRRRTPGTPVSLSDGTAPRNENGAPPSPGPRATFTGLIGTICMYPLRAIINACVALRIHPNTLTLIGVIVNVAAAWALGFER